MLDPHTSCNPAIFRLEKDLNFGTYLKSKYPYKPIILKNKIFLIHLVNYIYHVHQKYLIC